MTQTVAVPVPAPLYQRLERLAHLTNRSLENIVEQALTASLPTIPENLPDVIRDDLLALETLDDEALWQVAESALERPQQEQISLLLEKNALNTISQTEQVQLLDLQAEADRVMLRKAYAYALLKWRGHPLPSLAELEARG